MGQRLSWLPKRLTGPGALYNAGNLLALFAGIGLTLRENWGKPAMFDALQAHLIGSPGATWLTIAMLLFLLSGELYHRAGEPSAPAVLLPWADFISGLAAIALTLSLMHMGETNSALLAGGMLTLGKLGSAVLPLLKRLDRFDRAFRSIVVASRAPSLLTLGLVVFPALLGTVPTEQVLLPLVMIACFLLWLWADLLLLSRLPASRSNNHHFNAIP